VDRGEAIRIAKPRIERHFQSVADAASEHAGRQLSADYKNYDKMVEKVRRDVRVAAPASRRLRGHAG
jgi:hypothetical protein